MNNHSHDISPVERTPLGYNESNIKPRNTGYKEKAQYEPEGRSPNIPRRQISTNRPDQRGPPIPGMP